MYDFEWYLYDKKVAKFIGMLLYRSQFGSKIEVPFCEVSANTFLNVHYCHMRFKNI